MIKRNGFNSINIVHGPDEFEEVFELADTGQALEHDPGARFKRVEQTRQASLDLNRRVLAAKRATANRERTVAFDEERLAIVKDRLGDVLLSTVTCETIEGFQAKRKLDGVSNRTVNMDVGALRKVLKRYGHWRRLQDHVTMLSETEGAPIGRALTPRSRSGCRDRRQQSRVGTRLLRGGPRGEHADARHRG